MRQLRRVIASVRTYCPFVRNRRQLNWCHESERTRCHCLLRFGGADARPLGSPGNKPSGPVPRRVGKSGCPDRTIRFSGPQIRREAVPSQWIQARTLRPVLSRLTPRTRKGRVPPAGCSRGSGLATTAPDARRRASAIDRRISNAARAGHRPEVGRGSPDSWGKRPPHVALLF